MDDSGVQAMQGVSDAQSLQEQQAIESLSQVEGIHPEVWQGLDETERLSSLQDVENRMAGLQDRPSAEVVSREAGPGEFGSYNPEANQISIGSYSLQNDDVKEVVDTTVHEGWHAYQHYAVENPEVHPDAAEVEAWRENFDDYMTVDDYGQELYQSQPVEADAWRYGRRIANGLYGGE